MDPISKHPEAQQLSWNAHSQDIDDWITERKDAVRKGDWKTEMPYKSKPYNCLGGMSSWNNPEPRSRSSFTCHPSIVI